MCMCLKPVGVLCHPAITYEGKCGFRDLLNSQSDVCMGRKWSFLFFFAYHMRWCTGYGTFLCAFTLGRSASELT
jgi:hypothetical protein